MLYYDRKVEDNTNAGALIAASEASIKSEIRIEIAKEIRATEDRIVLKLEPEVIWVCCLLCLDSGCWGVIDY